MIEGLKVLAFDADDTLWSNEPLFREAERKVAERLSEYGDFDYISEETMVSGPRLMSCQ